MRTPSTRSLCIKSRTYPITGGSLPQGGVKYSDVKKDLCSRMWESFRPAREKRKQLEKNIGQIRDILKAGAEKARAKSAPNLDLVRRRVGLVY